VQRYPDDFVMALSLFLAHWIAPSVTKGEPPQAGDAGAPALQVQIAIAKAAAANEEQPDEPPNSEFERDRG